MAVADADGAILGVYRKSHIPDGPGYQEKYYFRPGDTGFKSWKTRHGTHRRRHLLGPMVPGVRARHGAAGRRDPALPDRHRLRTDDLTLDTQEQWQRAMQGHAVSNAVPIVAANRIGAEENDGVTQSYYGHSFIADHKGELVASFSSADEGALVASFDLGAIERYRAEWGFFRDRRTDLYAKTSDLVQFGG